MFSVKTLQDLEQYEDGLGEVIQLAPNVHLNLENRFMIFNKDVRYGFPTFNGESMHGEIADQYTQEKHITLEALVENGIPIIWGYIARHIKLIAFVTGYENISDSEVGPYTQFRLDANKVYLLEHNCLICLTDDGL